MEETNEKPVKRKYGPRKAKTNLEPVIDVQPESVPVALKTSEVTPQPAPRPSVVHNMITPDTMLMKAIEMGADIDKLEKLMNLVNQWQEKQARAAFFDSLSSFQAEVPELGKSKSVAFETKQGDKVGYNYAPLGVIDEAIKPLLRKHGLTKTWKIEEVNGILRVTCVITHVQGHSEKTTMEAPPDESGKKSAIQSKGSTVTYLQRYTLIGALGLTTADNDNDGRTPEARQEQQKEQAKGTVDKPKITQEQLNKVVSRIAQGEDIIAECRQTFTLTEKDKESLKVAEEIRLKNLKKENTDF